MSPKCNTIRSSPVRATSNEEEEDKDRVHAEINRLKKQNSSTFSKTAIRKRSSKFMHRQHRVIVRNLSYQITEAKLRESFERFGTIEEVNILKRPDGKLVGCAFLQFSKKEESDQAIREMDGGVFLGRKIEVSYALDKLAYQKFKAVKGLKKEKMKEAITVEDKDTQIKVEHDAENDDEDETDGVDDEADENDDYDDEDDEEEDEADDDDDDDERDNSEEDIKPAKSKPSVKREKNFSEIEEGRTVFVKNIPYEVEGEELTDLMAQFGTVERVLINKERISGHSKGTAFVIFRLRDSAEMCRRQHLKLQMHDQFLEILEALRKKDVMDREKTKLQTRSKDSRNLYLLKEGVIMAGSPAAKDVSKSDMAKRLRLEQRNNEVLKNFNRFVSRERLTMHNIPDHFTNNDLRNIIIKHTSHKPMECRVMRDAHPSFGHPLGKSREYGFVSFKRHETALEVLRKLNNNPNVFGKNNRPIVSFSIEDLKVHRIKQQRMEKSRLNNPTYQKKLEELKKKKQQKSAITKKAKRLELEQLVVAPSAVLRKITSRTSDAKADLLSKKKKERKRDIEQTITPFTGEISKQGVPAIRPIRKIKHQADAHMQRIKEERKQLKRKRTQEEHARNRQLKDSRHTKPKVNYQELKKEDSYFRETIGKYKEMINNAVKQPTRSKWYSE